MIEVVVAVNGVVIVTAKANDRGPAGGHDAVENRYEWTDSRRHYGDFDHRRAVGPLDLAARLLHEVDAASNADPKLDVDAFADLRAKAREQRHREAAKEAGFGPVPEIVKVDLTPPPPPKALPKGEPT